MASAGVSLPIIALTETYDIKCKICDKNEVGDEFQYFIICIAFQEDRLVKEYYRKYPSIYKLAELCLQLT